MSVQLSYMSTADQKLEFRISGPDKGLIEKAARLLDQRTADFARTTLIDRAADVVAESDRVTRLAPDYFDEVTRWLDEPAAHLPVLERALRQRHTKH